MTLSLHEREPSRWPRTLGTGVLQERLARTAQEKDSRPPLKRNTSLAFPLLFPPVLQDRAEGPVVPHDGECSSAEVIPLPRLALWQHGYLLLVAHLVSSLWQHSSQ